MINRRFQVSSVQFQQIEFSESKIRNRVLAVNEPLFIADILGLSVLVA